MNTTKTILSSLMILAFAALVVSCNSNPQNSTESRLMEVADTQPRGSAADTIKKKNNKLPICNTTWYYEEKNFGDEWGCIYELVLDIKDMARDGISAKVELDKKMTWKKKINNKWVTDEKQTDLDSWHLYGAIEPIYSDADKKENIIGYFINHYPYYWWDHDNGYLYDSEAAFMAESPNGRFKMKKE